MAYLHSKFAFGGYLERLLNPAIGSADSLGGFSFEERLMALAIEESMLAMGHASPNPAVGCVVWHNGKVVGRGHTGPPGQSHAERMAFDGLGGVWPEGATVAVTLEPCAHHGRTPPCLDLFERASSLRILIGCPDPNPAVSGRSLTRLQQWGHKVTVGVLEKEVGITLLPFFKNQIHGGVFVGLKWAQSLDGQLADDHSHSKWLTGESIRPYTHWLRHRYDGIAIGLGTFLIDKPSLTARELPLPVIAHHPKRFVLDPSGRLLRMTDYERRSLTEEFGGNLDDLTFVSAGLSDNSLDFFGARWWHVDTGGEAKFVTAWIRMLRDGGPPGDRQQPIYSLMIEGGAKTLACFLEEKQFDYLHNWIAGLLLGPGKHALRPGRGENEKQCLQQVERLKLIQSLPCGNDVLTEWATQETIGLLDRASSLKFATP